uniref:Uncharacterized protein n=2 Tax=Oryza TaxID=4527 RepID=A0A0E0N0N7_ORYRU
MNLPSLLPWISEESAVSSSMDGDLSSTAVSLSDSDVSARQREQSRLPLLAPELFTSAFLLHPVAAAAAASFAALSILVSGVCAAATTGFTSSGGGVASSVLDFVAVGGGAAMDLLAAAAAGGARGLRYTLHRTSSSEEAFCWAYLRPISTMIHPDRTRRGPSLLTNEKNWRRPIGRGLRMPPTTSLAPASECQHPPSPTARALLCPPVLLDRTVVKKYHALDPSLATAGEYLPVRSSGSAAYTSASWTYRHGFPPESTWRRRYLVTSSWSVGWEPKSAAGSASSGREGDMAERRRRPIWDRRSGRRCDGGKGRGEGRRRRVGVRMVKDSGRGMAAFIWGAVTRRNPESELGSARKRSRDVLITQALAGRRRSGVSFGVRIGVGVGVRAGIGVSDGLGRPF